MLFGKYHIVIFKERGGSSRNLRLRGWFGIFAFLIFSALVACNVWLWHNYRTAQSYETRLQEAQRTIEEQNTQMYSVVNKLRDVQSDLNRVQQFDTKLRLMMNMDKDMGEVALNGQDDFATSYLPLHRQELMARKMHAFLRQLSDETRLEEVRQQEILRSMRANRSLLASLPSIWPTEGFITSRFGSRPSPFTSQAETHKGMDISNKPGTPIYATAQGVVSMAGSDGAYGISAQVQHGGGIVTKFAHMQRVLVKEGQQVQRGDLIGHMGNTGRSTGPHLHYEVRLNGVSVNPMRYILN